MNKETKSRIRPINTKNKLMVAGGEGGWGWVKWVTEIQAFTYGIKGTLQGV